MLESLFAGLISPRIDTAMIFERPCSKFEFPVVDGAADYR